LKEGEWLVRFSHDHLRSYLDRHGEMPLPPYIKRPSPRASDLGRYQTVYAEKEGAVAAPTAGFHFTPGLLEKIHAKGVKVRPIILHIGWGTFRPVRTETIEQHQMLPESYEVTEDAAAELNQARQAGRRIIAVGTTVVRALETICDSRGTFRAGSGQANLFIYPGYRFKAVDTLITNFHLPDSTPLLLACAFYGGDSKRPFSLKAPYEEAILRKYRFYSYGDAMLIQ
jgi:S-adenosylmethionine:tRNA ribosyltransferase-isomerase